MKRPVPQALACGRAFRVVGAAGFARDVDSERPGANEPIARSIARRSVQGAWICGRLRRGGNVLAAGDTVPDFRVVTTDGRTIDYGSLWQRRNLLLVTLPDDRAASGWIARLAPRTGELTAHDTECVITTDPIQHLPQPGLLVADRWGEVHFVATAATADRLPDADALIEWLRFVQMHCPECEGENR